MNVLAINLQALHARAAADSRLRRPAREVS